MIEIIPAILPADYEDLASHLERVVGLTRVVQIDVVDGRFAPSITWPYRDRGSFESILSEEEGLPFWEEFDFEVDIMAEASKDAALEWVRAGASRIVIHIESPDDRGALEALQEYREGATAIEVGLAISLDTPVEKLDSLAQLGSFIQVMGIAHPGAQGNPFDMRAIPRVREICDRFPGHIVSVDGGVRDEHVQELVAAGATRLVVGSGIFEGDARENYTKLKLVVDSA